MKTKAELIREEIASFAAFKEFVLSRSEEELDELLRSQGYDPKELENNAKALIERLKNKLCQ